MASGSGAVGGVAGSRTEKDKVQAGHFTALPIASSLALITFSQYGQLICNIFRESHFGPTRWDMLPPALAHATPLPPALVCYLESMVANPSRLRGIR